MHCVYGRNYNIMKYTGILLVALMGLTGRAAAQEQVRQVSGFSKIGNGGSFAVHVKIDGTESLKIVGGDQATVAKIETVVRGGELEVRWKQGSEPHNYSGRIDVYVTAKVLTGLSNAGSGSLEVDGVVKGGTVDVGLAGSGTIKATVDAGKLNVDLSGSGMTTLKGKANSTHIDIAGSGGLSGESLSTDAVDAEIAGSGNAHIEANKTVSASIVGSGSLYYSGAATIKSSNIVGSGRVKKA
jgi:Putative auto-transporter adhesin, head GIN domain